MNVRFSVPNAVDTSELSSNKEVELTFSSQKSNSASKRNACCRLDLIFNEFFF